MERRHFVRKKRDTRLSDAFRVIVLTTLLLIVSTNQSVKTVDQRNIPSHASVHPLVPVETVVVTIEVHLKIVPSILKLYRNSEKIIFFKFVNMKIFSINCQSWKTAKSDFNEIVDSYGVDVLCLTETFENGKEPVTFRQWSKISKSRKDGYGGVAILYKDDEDGVIMERKQDLELDTVEVICTKVTTSRNNTFLLVVAYVPPEKKEQLEGLLTVLDKCKDNKHIILTGDLNSKSLDWHNKKSNTCGNILEDYINRTGLLCINDGRPTRRQSDSVIDLFIVSPRVAMCETMSHEVIRSDHIGVLLDVYQENKQNNAILEKYIISKAKYDVWMECTEDMFKQWNRSGRKYGSLDEMADAFMDIYTQCLIEAVPKREIKVQNRRKKRPWWND